MSGVAVLRSFVFNFCVAVAVMVVARVSLAETPAVTALFPPGVQSGRSVLVELRGKVGDKSPSVWCSRSDLLFEPGEVPSEFTVTASAGALPGIAWVRFYNAEGASEPRPLWVGNLPETLEKERNNKISGRLRQELLPVTINGVLHRRGEVDMFAVMLNASQTLISSIDAHRLFGSPMDGVLQIVSPSGFVITQNDDDHGFDPLIEFTAPENGLYFVRVFAFPANPDSSINYAGGEDYVYRLTLTSSTVVDHVAPLAVNASAPAPLYPRGWQIPGEPTPLMPLLQEDVVQLALPGYTLALPHRLPVVDVPSLMEHPIAAGEAPQLITVPSCITGALSASGDVDQFRFQGTKDQELRFSVDARKLDSPLDPMLRLIGPDGNLLKDQDDEGRKELDLSFTEKLPADGEYRVEVRDRFGAGSSRHFYLLTVAPPKPDFALSVAANRFTLKPGEPLEIEVEIDRVDGFKDEIILTVDGLPADSSVTLTEAKSAGEGDTSKKVKIKLESTGTAFTGPVRILGASGDRRRFATAPLPNVPDRIESLWLTVLK